MNSNPAPMRVHAEAYRGGPHEPSSGRLSRQAAHDASKVRVRAVAAVPAGGREPTKRPPLLDATDAARRSLGGRMEVPGRRG